MAKQARTVLSLAFGLAVRYDAIEKNPVRDTARLRKPPSQAMALTARAGRGDPQSGPGMAAWRRAVRARRRTASWSRSSRSCSARRPASARCSRSASATWTSRHRRPRCGICGTIVSPGGKPTHRQPHPKTAKSTRTVSVPSLHRRGAARSDWSSSPSRGPGAPDLLHPQRHPADDEQRPTAAAQRPGRRPASTGVTPHSFRRTVATVHRPSRRRRPRRRDARSHLLGDHQGALHRARREGEPGDSRDPGVAGSEDLGGG